MLLGNSIYFDHSTLFRNSQRDNMTFKEVYERILEFIKDDLGSPYRVSIGTDSQVGAGTIFVSCIHVHRIGKGAIGFLHKTQIPRQIKSLREKIYLETCATLQLSYMFEEGHIHEIRRTVGKNVDFEFHIDVGTKGETKALINEMVGMVNGLSFKPKIKPDSYCASCFADRYTRAM